MDYENYSLREMLIETLKEYKKNISYEKTYWPDFFYFWISSQKPSEYIAILVINKVKRLLNFTGIFFEPCMYLDSIDNVNNRIEIIENLLNNRELEVSLDEKII